MRNVVVTLAAALGLAACAGPHASGLYETHASAARLRNAAIVATHAIHYHVVNTDAQDGIIMAEQYVAMGHGEAVGLNAQITDSGGRGYLQVSLSAPPLTFTFGSFDKTRDAYVGVIHRMIPDLAPASEPVLSLR